MLTKQAHHKEAGRHITVATGRSVRACVRTYDTSRHGHAWPIAFGQLAPPGRIPAAAASRLYMY